MKSEYDFSTGAQGSVIQAEGKTRITTFIDTDVLEVFRAQAAEQGTGYQTLLNAALRAAAFPEKRHELVVTVEVDGVRRVLREAA